MSVHRIYKVPTLSNKQCNGSRISKKKYLLWAETVSYVNIMVIKFSLFTRKTSPNSLSGASRSTKGLHIYNNVQEKGIDRCSRSNHVNGSRPLPLLSNLEMSYFISILLTPSVHIDLEHTRSRDHPMVTTV